MEKQIVRLKKCKICKNKIPKNPKISRKYYREKVKFCSNKCVGVYNKDRPAHNKGKKISEETKALISLHSATKGKFKKNACYGSIHSWVRRELGNPLKCTYCEKDKNEGRIEWASISHNAKRDLNDYISLCVRCHRIYDGNWMMARGVKKEYGK